MWVTYLRQGSWMDVIIKFSKNIDLNFTIVIYLIVMYLGYQNGPVVRLYCEPGDGDHLEADPVQRVVSFLKSILD